MPELPEVETIVRTYRPRLEGRIIRAFESSWPRRVAPSVAVVRRRTVGRRITRLHRRAKYIVFDLEAGGHLLVHLRMSGRFEWAADNPDADRHTRAIWTLDGDDALWFVDARKFGRIEWTADLAAATAHLGIEPLSRGFTVARLTSLLRGRARQLKPLLLDQSLIAGLGNIYVDESLFRSGLHPLRSADSLNADERAALHEAIRHVLRKAIRRHGTSIDWIYPDGEMQDELTAYGRTGLPCVRCRTPIESLRVGQRGTHICPRCQPRHRRRPRGPNRPGGTRVSKGAAPRRRRAGTRP